MAVARKCLLVLCGLPAAGKTTLAAELAALAAGSSIQAAVVTFDDFGLTHLEGEFDAAAWKANRQEALSQVALRLIPDPDADQQQLGRQLLVIVDDNMQYRSMRQECFRLAQEHQAAFLQLYILLSLEDALLRNARRPAAARVPDPVIRRMQAVLEPPQPGRHAWEAATLTWAPAVHGGVEQPAHRLCDAVRCSLWESIISLWGPPPAPAVPDQVRKAHLQEQQSATWANALHALDLHCRRRISAIVKAASTTADRQGLAQALNRARADALARWTHWTRCRSHCHMCLGMLAAISCMSIGVHQGDVITSLISLCLRRMQLYGS